ncbi:hypothetical protein BH23GEM10_BH23GEM10_00540 [soil metagenome]
MFAIAAAILQDGLTLSEVVQNLPHDAAAIVVYVLIISFGAFIWYGSRQKAG